MADNDIFRLIPRDLAGILLGLLALEVLIFYPFYF